MGGYGSGRRYGASPKDTVEECLVLSCAKLQRDKLIREGFRGDGSLTWRNTYTDEAISSVGYSVNTLDPAGPWIRLDYTSTRTGEHVGLRIGLTTTPLPWGGWRWWFLCPLIRDGRPCRRRCGKLNLPPGGQYFGCRICYDLTYESAQTAHKFDRVFMELATHLGIPVRAVKNLLDRGGAR